MVNILIDASVDESMQIRIFNPDFSGMSTQELETLIERADLPSLGYKKITETKTETDFETGRLQGLNYRVSKIKTEYAQKLCRHYAELMKVNQ